MRDLFGRTGHTEAVLVVFDPKKVSYDALLKTFWESHDPTQGMRQGNDIGTQYRSAIYTTSDAQMKAALASKDAYNKALNAKRYGSITTEIKPAGEFYFAEDYHQQYLAKNPAGYCRPRRNRRVVPDRSRCERLTHDPEKWKPVFRSDHAQLTPRLLFINHKCRKPGLSLM